MLCQDVLVTIYHSDNEHIIMLSLSSYVLFLYQVTICGDFSVTTLIAEVLLKFYSLEHLPACNVKNLKTKHLFFVYLSIIGVCALICKSFVFSIAATMAIHI